MIAYSHIKKVGTGEIHTREASNKENIIRNLSTFVREEYTCRRGSGRKDTAELEPDICGVSVSCDKGWGTRESRDYQSMGG